MEGVGREGRSTPPSLLRCGVDGTVTGAGGLHWCVGGRALQAGDVPLLGGVGDYDLRNDGSMWELVDGTLTQAWLMCVCGEGKKVVLLVFFFVWG